MHIGSKVFIAETWRIRKEREKVFTRFARTHLTRRSICPPLSLICKDASKKRKRDTW